MHQIYVALRIYREDNNKYPAALLGFVQNTRRHLLHGRGRQSRAD